MLENKSLDFQRIRRFLKKKCTSSCTLEIIRQHLYVQST